MDWKAKARPTVHALRRFIRRLRQRPKTRQELQRYWSAPPDEGNMPESYLQESESARSEFLVSLIRKYAGFESRIMEIGCNAGRNLNFLFHAGFQNLSAIEISERAIAKFREAFPEVAAHVDIRHAPVEEALSDYQSNSMDMIFTMAVLEHIHPDSSAIFGEMVRVARRWIVTIEDEMDISERHFPRNYKRVFEKLGIRQLEEGPAMERFGLPAGFVARVFEKKEVMASHDRRGNSV